MVDYFHCQRLSFEWRKYSTFAYCTPTIKQLYKQLLNAPMNNSFDILASTPNRQGHIGPYYAVPHGWAECTNPRGCVFNGIHLFLSHN